MKEKQVGEILTDTRHMGEYLAVRARRLPDGSQVGKVIESGTDPDIVHGIIRRDIRIHEGTGAEFTYYCYKPFRLGEDREGWIIDTNGDRR